jgi:hypothetical protein
VLVTAYALLRPNGQWSLMLINKDYDHPHQVRIVFHDDNSETDRSFAGLVSVITFGKGQYQWYPAKRNGYAEPDGPALRSTVSGGKDSFYACRGSAQSSVPAEKLSREPEESGAPSMASPILISVGCRFDQQQIARPSSTTNRNA